ncbi:tyrosine-type recombinase/integrase [Streptomyces sp. NPDC017979]|uniref:tyrosine-type recombinase/integrase n=1 Tax=Streptomyces sp. NPDC017979 TaxID=3365024 RepID=UPI0037A1642B
MASIVERPKKDGTVTYQVKWRQDGGWQTENFSDDGQADQFKKLVEAHGNRWPHGWVRGKGFVEEPSIPGDVPWVEYGTRYINRLTGIDERTREDYLRELRIHLSLLQHVDAAGREHPATVCNVTQDDVTDWVRVEEKGEPDPDGLEKWARRPADPKSIANRHGLMFCIFQAAVEATPQLRTTNPCKRTNLPRVDDHVDEEMCFLERDEYARVAAEITDPDARDLADWLVGTGMRWGEASALKVSDLNLTSDRPSVSVQRAWKKAKKGSLGGSFFLGPPKTKKARRIIALAPAQVEVARRHATGRSHDDYLFRTATGRHWRHSNFYHRKWQPAVRLAIEKGLPKRPRLHDLRHTHVAWLIGAGIPLPAIQIRLGHESIQTTVDRYGHLVRSLDDDIITAVEAVMGVPAPRAGLRAV